MIWMPREAHSLDLMFEDIREIPNFKSICTKARSNHYEKDFWNRVHKVLKVMHPLVDVLCMVDSDERSSMGYIYEAMDRAKEKIKVNLKNEESSYQPIWDIIDKRWEDQLHRPLHAAGLYLNHILFYDYPDIESIYEIKDWLFKCISSLIGSPLDQSKIHDQMVAYRKAEGPFGMDTTIQNTFERVIIPKQLLSFKYGRCSHAKILCIQLDTKKRNRLQHKKLNDLVYVAYNQRLNEQ
ncbi:hypothetical protein EJ110_NYTH49320 [Nymphaea thermarum]|nr:hypothetical protein EJ110_NYTH49320 [Nymphaea thermarum]